MADKRAQGAVARPEQRRAHRRQGEQARPHALYEVLVTLPNGRQQVRRFEAESAELARERVARDLQEHERGKPVVADVFPAGSRSVGLDSGQS